MKRLLQLVGVVAVFAAVFAASGSALTFQDRTCDNSKPTCPLPDGQAQVPYTFDMYARSGCPPYHYNVTGGGLPPGLSLSTVNDSASGGIGRLQGTPTTPGSYSFWVTITTPESPTCLGDRADRLFTLSIAQAPLAITTASLRRGIVGQPYTETLAASGSGDKTWSATGLPPGLALSGNTITGTPTTAGDYTVTVTVSNGAGTKSAQYPLKVIEPLKVAGAGRRAAEVGRPFKAALRATGGSGGYTWVVANVPGGLTFDAVSHVISGTPTTPGAYTVKITVSDATAGLTQDLDLALNVVSHVKIANRRLRAATVGKAYELNLLANDGLAPFRWRSLGKVPAGMKVTKAGALVGTPLIAGTFKIKVRVRDALNAVDTETLRITVHA